MAKFTAEIDAICKMLKKKKIETAVITGKTKDRDAERIKFQTNPDCKVFVGQIQATSMGITLTAASTMIFTVLLLIMQIIFKQRQEYIVSVKLINVLIFICLPKIQLMNIFLMH